jgi:hypothetical protein
MKRINKFLQLSVRDKLLLLKSFLALAAVRAGLSLLPFQTLRQLLGFFTPTTAAFTETDCASMHRVSYAVKTMSRYIPGASCLTQALAAHMLLARIGQPAALRIGVARSQEGQFQAHAWVEIQGRIVVGKLPDMRRYAVLPPLEK